ncbi:MAG TPA: nucleoside deaminase [Polyangiaceae bacterium]|nr:nucleoside deaminase [Polyangiaceae bacterium]
MQQRYLERAIELAAVGMAQGGGGPFGAVVVRGDQIVAEGFNQVTGSHDPTAHAEVSAIRSACKALATFTLQGCEIYSSCEPCPMCLSAIYWARLDRLYYAATRTDAAEIGFDDAFLYTELTLDPAERRLPSVHALREQARQVMLPWKEMPRDRRY